MVAKDYKYRRRPTVEVHVGKVTIGGDAPIRLQSMTNTATMDTEASVDQCERIARAGADIVRLTAQGVQHARNMGKIRTELRNRGVDIPLVADIHFNPAAAFAAAEEVEKVRINPGNFVDPGRTFRKISYTDDEYAAEIERIRQKFVPFLEVCRAHGTAIRIGVNHGSLSDRIMSRYGDTPEGMTESAMEFLRICVNEGFTDVVISIKASNVVVMTRTVRMLVDAMEHEGMNFPLHLGVTEAGDGEDARIKSAVGIGSLLLDGIGDTIRVSLSEAPENEIPVAAMLARHVARTANAPVPEGSVPAGINKIISGRMRRPTDVCGTLGGDNVPAVMNLDIKHIPAGAKLLRAAYPAVMPTLRKSLYEMEAAGDRSPAILMAVYPETLSPEEVVVAASADLGSLLLEGYGDALWIEAPQLSQEQLDSLALGILQATRRRISKTEYIACPGCGRTLFGLQEVLARVKAATSHLKGLKIGVMGCIVNGPGEMADADYGYVGAAAGHVSLYKGKECVVRNVPQDEAVDQLIKLIKDNGDWNEPES